MKAILKLFLRKASARSFCIEEDCGVIISLVHWWKKGVLNMLLSTQNTCFMLIDVQEKLTPFVIHYQQLLKRCAWLLSLAKELNIPILVSEQYPKGLGHTVAELKPWIEDSQCFDKIYFSAGKDPKIRKEVQQAGYQQLILFGIEAHVCVLQSAMDFKSQGFDVFVVADAISSRAQMDMDFAKNRMRQHGIQLVTSEMVFFELIEKAGTETFKRLSLQFLPRQ